MQANWHPDCFRCEICNDGLADSGFVKNAGRYVTVILDTISYVKFKKKETCTIHVSINLWNLCGSLGDLEMLGNLNWQGRILDPQLFQVLLNFHKCFCNWIETLSKKTLWQKTCFLWSSKCKFSLLAPSLHQQLMLQPWSKHHGTGMKIKRQTVLRQINSESTS